MSDASWTLIVQDWLSQLSSQFSTYLPSLLGAATLLVAGWVLARILQVISERLLRTVMSWLFRNPIIQGSAIRPEAQQSVPPLIGTIIFWVVLLLFVAGAIEVLGLPVVANLLSGVAAYLPRLLVAVIIVLLALLAGAVVNRAVAKAATSAALTHADWFGQLLRYAIIGVGFVVAIDQLGIDSTFLILLAAIVAGTTLGAAALAFGLGARSAVSNLLASQYVQRHYQVGQMIKIGQVEGRIAQILPTTVILDTASGRLMVPAQRFHEEISVLVNSTG